jgi:hypothetical protein
MPKIAFRRIRFTAAAKCWSSGEMLQASRALPVS